MHAKFLPLPFLPLPMAILWMACVPARAATDFDYGPRPSAAVFDPSGILSPNVAKDISEPLTTIYRKENVDVMVVVLPDVGQAPPEHVAGRFAAAWCTSAVHCVVLHVPGREDSPWIVPGGRLIGYVKPEEIGKDVITARRHAASEMKDADKIKVAATEASDLMRYWLAKAVNHSQAILTEKTRMRLEQETKAQQQRIAMLASAAAFVPLVVGISLLISLIRRRGPAYFPRHTLQPRLGAPHSGGNHATVDLSKIHR